jgi:hypothetical protein
MKKEKITGAIHAMALMVKGLCRYLNVALPYPLKLTEHGVIIKDSLEKYLSFLINLVHSLCIWTELSKSLR